MSSGSLGLFGNEIEYIRKCKTFLTTKMELELELELEGSGSGQSSVLTTKSTKSSTSTTVSTTSLSSTTNAILLHTDNGDDEVVRAIAAVFLVSFMVAVILFMFRASLKQSGEQYTHEPLLIGMKPLSHNTEDESDDEDVLVLSREKLTNIPSEEV